jgi:hypothetical protein
MCQPRSNTGVEIELTTHPRHTHTHTHTHDTRHTTHDTHNNNNKRAQVTVSKVAPLDFVSEGRHLLEMIHKLEAGQVIYGPSAAAGGAAAGAALCLCVCVCVCVCVCGPASDGALHQSAVAVDG